MIHLPRFLKEQPVHAGLPAVTYVNPSDPPLRRLTIELIEKLSGQPRIQRIYHDYHLNADVTASFWEEALHRLRITVDCCSLQADAIPAKGGLVVIANHPFGVVDGLILCYLVARKRRDFKLLAHEIYGRAPEMRECLLPVSFTETTEARRINIKTCRRAIQYVRDGGAVILFPAGGVSTARSVFGRATDAPWQPFTAKLINAARATVLPVHFQGQNSWLFHAASYVAVSCREALLINEAMRRMDTEVQLRIGEAIAYETLESRDDPVKMLQQLRQEIDKLNRPDSSPPHWRRFRSFKENALAQNRLAKLGKGLTKASH